MPSFIIGIGGCSCSGKTTISVGLLHLMKKKGYKTELVQLDRYFKPFPKDWESPDAIDWDKLRQRIDMCPKGVILILEGFLIYHLKDVKFDIKFLLDLEVSILARRRRFRSEEYHWSEPPDHMEKWVYPSYKKNNEEIFSNIDDFFVVKHPRRPEMIVKDFYNKIEPILEQKHIKINKTLVKAGNVFFQGEELSFE